MVLFLGLAPYLYRFMTEMRVLVPGLSKHQIRITSAVARDGSLTDLLDFRSGDHP